MIGHQFLPSHLHSIITLFFLLILSPSSYCDTECSEPFDCGLLPNLSYPFWRDGGCGLEGFKLRCEDDHFPVMNISELEFRVLSVNPSLNRMTIARTDLFGDVCTENFFNTTLNQAFFNFVPDFSARFLTTSLFYNCTGQISTANRNSDFPCPVYGEARDAIWVFDLNQLSRDSRLYIEKSCNIRVDVPVPRFHDPQLQYLKEALQKGFDVSYSECIACVNSSGTCGTNSTGGFNCSHGSNFNLPLKLGIGLGIAVATIISTLLGLCYFIKRLRFLSGMATKLRRKNPKQDEKIEALIVSSHSLMPKRYSYSDIRKMTNSFSEKLGQGGFGSVYKGKLSDGRPVAVKLLIKSIGDGEEFINEVASISRTSHVNVVTLLGFCYERTKRALVYQYMPNGSLDKFICNQDFQNKTCFLDQEKLCEIAIGIARGLEYLHRGCNTRIVHFDIKPHNILLDVDFCPKIADFGLAKLCKGKESIMSLLSTRGTIGYIAPEVFMRSFGPVSYKSDVYSYGMVILEMFGGRNNTDNGQMQTSEMYFPDWIYKYLVTGQVSVNGENITEGEEETVRKMSIVGLWCIQTNPSNRPSMTKVIEMLEGNLESLEIPPKPQFLPSPKTAIEFSTLSSTVDVQPQKEHEYILALAEPEFAPN